MTSPTVSVIIPAYRAAHTIKRALDSVFGQSHAVDEVLLVDDGSPDDMAEAVRSYGDQVTLLRKPNGGAASARNLGLDRARGEWIAFLDADDYWEKQKLDRQFSVIRTNSELGLVCGRWFTQVPGEERAAPAAIRDLDFDRILAPKGDEIFRVATKLWTSTILVRKTVVGSHRFTSGLEPAEDRDLWVRLVDAAPIYMTSEPLATYVQEPGSLCRSNVDRDYGNMMRVVHRHVDLLGRNGVRRWEKEFFRRWAASHLGNGHPRAALRPAFKRLVKNPLSLEAWWVLLKSGVFAYRG